ncbi:MAG: GTP-binding protein [Thermoplasmata archaeon]|nr:GTP-binding protein [Thermoplasmata archaeon]
MAIEEIILKKIVLLGDSAVGKTSMIRRFVHDQFDDKYISTIGAKVSKKIMPVKFQGNDYEVKLMVWDILGSQGYESTQSRHIAGLNGAILITDLTKPETQKSLEEYWIPLLKEVTGGVLPTILFAGNKNDLISGEEQVADISSNFKELESKYCKDLETRTESGCGGWLMTSAKTGDNVEKGFHSLVLGMLAEHPLYDPLNRQMEEVIADGIYEAADRDTPRSVLDIIVVDLPHVLLSTDKSTQILQESISTMGFSKNDPTLQNVNDFIDLVLMKALEMGATAKNVEEYRNKWLEILSKMKAPQT